MDPLSSPGSSNSKQNPHLSTKTTNNAELWGWGIRCHSSPQGFHFPRERGLTAPSTTRFKHIFFSFIFDKNPFFRAEVKPKHEASFGWGWAQPWSQPCPARSPPAPHSFIFSSKDLSEMYKHQKFLMSYPQPSSAGNEVIHAVRILIYHQQKTSQGRGKSHVLLKPVFGVINHNNFISYRTTSWFLFLRVVFKELWKTFNGLREKKPAGLFWKCQNGKDSWKSGLLPCSCLEDLLCASPELSAKCSTSIVSQKAMSDFTSSAGSKQGSSIKLGTDTSDHVQALSNI